MATITEALQTAVAYHQRGQLQQAEAIYQRILQIHPGNVDALHLLGVAAQQQGRADEAIKYIQRAIERAPRNASFHNNLGEAYRRLGQLEDAIRCYQRALELDPNYVGALNNLGSALCDAGQKDDAVDFYERALRIAPDSAEVHNNHGILRRARKQPGLAAQSLQRAIMLRPDFAEAYNNLGNALKDLEEFDNSEASYRRAIALRTDYAEAYNNLGNLLQIRGQLEEAIKFHLAALEFNPSLIEAHKDLANAYYKQSHLKLAEKHYRRTLELIPDDADVLNALGSVLGDQGGYDEAVDCYRKAVRVEPDRPLWELRIAAQCPAVFLSSAEMHEYRENLMAELERFQQMDLQADVSELAASGANPAFSMQFLDGNLRPIREAFAKIFQNLPQEELPPRRGKKLRIGIVVSRGHERVFIKSMQGVLKRIDTREFEIEIISARASIAQLRQGIENDSIGLLPMPVPFDKTVEAIRSACFDLLYYWEVCSDSTNFFLPFFRLAPVQCTSWGIQITTGIPNVDYYLSSELVESVGADDHYSESLIQAKTLLTFQERQVAPKSPQSRGAFGFDHRQHIYLCSQQLGKFHPDFDQLLGEILRRDADGVLVLTTDRFGYAEGRLRQRFSVTLADVLDRIVFLPQQRGDDYLSLVEAADVMLDPLHFGGVNTTYDGFSLNKPIVALPSEFHRGRYTFGCYRKMGVLDCVASSFDEYVDIAVRLGSDSDYREAVESRIREASPVLFEDAEAVREHERLFRECLVAQRQFLA